MHHGGGARKRGFSCWDKYLAMAFAQLTYRDSLRDIEACQRTVGSQLNHLASAAVWAVLRGPTSIYDFDLDFHGRPLVPCSADGKPVAPIFIGRTAAKPARACGGSAAEMRNQA